MPLRPRFLPRAYNVGGTLHDPNTTPLCVPPCRHQAGLEGKIDLDNAAFLVVTGVWSPGSLIESPVLYTKEDGTEVSTFNSSNVE